MSRTSKLVIGFTLLCLLSLHDTVAESYRKKNELLLKVGMFPLMESCASYFIGVIDALVSPFAGKSSSFDTAVYTIPSFSVEYLRNIANRHAVGTTATVGVPFYGTSAPESMLILYYVSMTFKYRFTYWQNSRVRLYGSAAIGCELFFIKTERDEENYMQRYGSFQNVGFGVQFGGDTMFGVAELGVGTEGSLLVLGAGFKF